MLLVHPGETIRSRPTGGSHRRAVRLRPAKTFALSGALHVEKAKSVVYWLSLARRNVVNRDVQAGTRLTWTVPWRASTHLAGHIRNYPAPTPDPLSPIERLAD
jgi:hypothetical protein